MESETYSTRTLRYADEFDAIQRQWNALLESTDGHTCFQSHGFLSEWWRAFGDSKDLVLVCTFLGDDLVGAIALQRVEVRLAGVRTKVLQFVGMPNDVLRPTILARREDKAILCSLLSELEVLPGGWHVIRLEELPSNAWFTSELRLWAKDRRFGFYGQPFHVCPYLEKSGTWAGFLDSRSKRFASRIRYLNARLGKAGKVTFEQESSPTDPEKFIDWFIDVEQKSWKAGKPAAVGLDQRYREFYRRLLGKNGAGDVQGHIVLLKLDAEIAAVTFGISWHGTYHALQIAHDRDFDRYSPGFLLEAHEMQWFFGNAALQRYEFLGGEVFSKRRWTGRAVATDLVLIYRGSYHVACYVFVKYRLLPLLLNVWRRLLRRRTPAIEPFRTD